MNPDDERRQRLAHAAAAKAASRARETADERRQRLDRTADVLTQFCFCSQFHRPKSLKCLRISRIL
jgi:hypothetical protein